MYGSERDWSEAFNFAQLTPSAEIVQIGSSERLQGRKAENQSWKQKFSV